jgi:hypothetical protein
VPGGMKSTVAAGFIDEGSFCGEIEWLAHVCKIALEFGAALVTGLQPWNPDTGVYVHDCNSMERSLLLVEGSGNDLQEMWVCVY